MDHINQLQEKLPQNSCALVTSDVNRRYFTGMKSSAGVVMIFPDIAYLLIDFRYIEKAQSTVKNCTVIRMTNMYDQISEIMKKHGCTQLLIENETMTVAELDRLWDRMSAEIEIDSGDTLSAIIGDMRMIKSEDEIEKMTCAQRIAEKAFENVLDFIKEGVTEREIALFLNDHMLRNGAEDISFETIALCGQTTSMPHGVPSDRTVKKGDFVLMDFGAVFEGYHSDMTRTVAVGDVSEEMEKVYSIVLEAQNRAINAAKTGITGKRLDQVGRDFIAANGYGECFGHGLGHCVGMEIHESPCANTRDDTILTDNMVITVEPGIYIPGKFGVRIEDFVVIKQNSCINLTNAPKNLIKL